MLLEYFIEECQASQECPPHVVSPKLLGYGRDYPIERIGRDFFSDAAIGQDHNLMLEEPDQKEDAVAPLGAVQLVFEEHCLCVLPNLDFSTLGGNEQARKR